MRTAYSIVNKTRLVDAVYLSVSLSLRNAASMVREVIIKLTRAQEGGIRGGGIGILERKVFKGVVLAWAHSSSKTPS